MPRQLAYNNLVLQSPEMSYGYILSVDNHHTTRMCMHASTTTLISSDDIRFIFIYIFYFYTAVYGQKRTRDPFPISYDDACV